MKTVKRIVVFIFPLFLTGALYGCAGMEQPRAGFDPAGQARIRVFHGPSVDLYLGDLCDGEAHPVIHAASGGFSFLTPNKTIGMPPTDDMPWSYHEYPIPAGRPVTIRMYWQNQKASGAWESCGPLHMEFTPENGQDYDTFLKFERGACQRIELRKFVTDANGKISTKYPSISKLPYRDCS